MKKKKKLVGGALRLSLLYADELSHGKKPLSLIDTVLHLQQEDISSQRCIRSIFISFWDQRGALHKKCLFFFPSVLNSAVNTTHVFNAVNRLIVYLITQEQASAEGFLGLNRMTAVGHWTDFCEHRRKNQEEREGGWWWWGEKRYKKSRDIKQVLNRILPKATVRS